MLSEPTTNSEAVGKLPRGTILIQTGERVGLFVAVEVELVDTVVKGWVTSLAIKKGNTAQAEGTPTGIVRPLPKPKKGLIPKDESVLLRRQPSFYYGIYLGLPYAILDSSFSPYVYQGLGVQVGGNIGWYLDTYIDLRFFGQYTSLNGSSEDGSTVGYGTFDLGVAPELIVNEFRIFGLFYYGFGASLGELPTVYRLQSATDIAGLWVGIGVGYRYAFNETLAMTPRLAYSISFNRTVIGMQWFGLAIAIEFQG